MPSVAKTQRWLDLLAALLLRHYGATFEDLADAVPGYRHDGTSKGIASAKRTFERDKDELRALGVPIESRTTPGEEDEPEGHRYLLRPAAFYLPLVTGTLPAPRRGGTAPRPPARGHGYHALGTVPVEFDALEALVHAGDRARTLGDPLLAIEAEGALRKLAFDQPLAVAADGTVLVVEATPRARRDVHAATLDALKHRKRLTFDYHSMQRDAHARRTAEPYGLVLTSGHWYLVARDVEANALRQYRLSRMGAAQVNAQQPRTADYAIPPDFDLAESARARHSWELGDGDATEVVVHFASTRGDVRHALVLGRPVPRRAGHRAFAVRRPDAFVRWLMSFAGVARPISPPAIVKAWRAAVAATAAHYDGSGSA